MIKYFTSANHAWRCLNRMIFSEAEFQRWMVKFYLQLYFWYASTVNVLVVVNSALCHAVILLWISRPT